jgi:hypothetical protein
VPEEAETGKQFFELGRIMHDAMPAANSENSHEGDLLVKLKDTEYAYHCHSIVLAQGKTAFRTPLCLIYRLGVFSGIVPLWHEGQQST